MMRDILRWTGYMYCLGDGEFTKKECGSEVEGPDVRGRTEWRSPVDEGKREGRTGPNEKRVMEQEELEILLSWPSP